MSCPCDSSSTTTVVSCCSIHGVVPNGIGFRAQVSNAGGAVGGLEIPIYTADGGVTPLVMSGTTRLWLSSAQLIITSTGDSILYRGTSVGDDSILNNIILGGPFSQNGGMVLSLPWIRLALAEKLFVKTAGADLFRATIYGVYESI